MKRAPIKSLFLGVTLNRAFLELPVANGGSSAGAFLALVQRKGENVMKTLISMLAVGLALAFAGPAFAQNVKTAKDAQNCANAGGVWDNATQTCSQKKK